MGDLGITNVVEMDWWQSQQFRGLTFTCTPAQHSSGRGLRDQNLRLWSSWVVSGGGKRFFFAGDTGYTKALAEIGKRLGPFDLAAIPIGGHNAWGAGHPQPRHPGGAPPLLQDPAGPPLRAVPLRPFPMDPQLLPVSPAPPVTPMRGALPRRGGPLALGAREAADEVVVHHPGGLHERVADRRAHEGEAARLEVAAQRLREVGHRRHLPRLPPAVLERPPVHVAPEPGIERALDALDLAERARVAHGRGDLAAVTHDALVAQPRAEEIGRAHV